MRENFSTNWYPEPPASLEAIKTLLTESGLDLPQEYTAFLAFSNGGSGELGIDPGWFLLWPVEEVVEANRGYEVQEWLPGFFGFGSNGGGELLAFDTRMPHPWKICMVPFISLDGEEVILVADDFASFIKAIGQQLDDEKS